MNSATQYPHLTSGPDGQLRVSDSRYKALHLAGEHYHYGWTAEELLRQHPDLRPEEVYSVLTWFYDHYDEVVQKLAEVRERVQETRGSQSLSRDELLRRRRLTESG
jgi:uncharacterized protein (DUF433 family)